MVCKSVLLNDFEHNFALEHLHIHINFFTSKMRTFCPKWGVRIPPPPVTRPQPTPLTVLHVQQQTINIDRVCCGCDMLSRLEHKCYEIYLADISSADISLAEPGVAMITPPSH